MRNKIFYLIFIMTVSMAGSSFAQNDMEAMRSLTVNALMQYGQQLYDRGDFGGARAVFKHVLSFDHHQTLAIDYLKDMGYSFDNVLPPTVEVPITKIAEVSDPLSLKRAIEAKKKSIEALRIQIKEIRADIAEESLQK